MLVSWSAASSGSHSTAMRRGACQGGLPARPGPHPGRVCSRVPHMPRDSLGRGIGCRQYLLMLAHFVSDLLF